MTSGDVMARVTLTAGSGRLGSAPSGLCWLHSEFDFSTRSLHLLEIKVHIFMEQFRNGEIEQADHTSNNVRGGNTVDK